MKIIIGLGNPGVKYENTRHNAGFMVLDKLAQKCNLEFNQEKVFCIFRQRKSKKRRRDFIKTYNLYE